LSACYEDEGCGGADGLQHLEGGAGIELRERVVGENDVGHKLAESANECVS
jgi:hypothetical protein